MLGGALPSRRNFLMLTAGAGALALAGCANGGSVTTSIPTWVSAIQAIGTEVGQIVTQLPSSVPAATASQIQTIISEIQQAASAVGAASTQSAGQSTLSQIEAYINDLAPLVLPFVSAIPGGSIIGIIVAALPAIEVALNMLISTLSPTAKTLVSTAPALPASKKFGATPLQVSQQYLNLLLHKASARFGRRFHAK